MENMNGQFFSVDMAEDGSYSFDSDGFDEESNCSWISEPESLHNAWRDWSCWKNAKASSSRRQNVATASANGTYDML